MSRSDHSSKHEALKRAISRKPRFCIHALHEMTEIGYPELEGMLAGLIKQGTITHHPDADLGDEDRQYLYTGSRKLDINQFKPGKLSPLVGLEEHEMRGRVTMLERMRRLLICDWHPILDIIINDYKKDIRRIEVARYGADEDDKDEPEL